mmetsp:Transcript_5953/g.18990  ORF Transcript_5953/g.18990 Transcript_5953/m.18990 type:complete len:207 (-) Transcript_5953:1297-1917(-)
MRPSQDSGFGRGVGQPVRRLHTVHLRGGCLPVWDGIGFRLGTGRRGKVPPAPPKHPLPHRVHLGASAQRLRHLRLWCKHEPAVEPCTPVRRWGDQVGHRRAAQAPVAARDLAKELNTTPLGVPPEDEHHRAAGRNRLHILVGGPLRRAGAHSARLAEGLPARFDGPQVTRLQALSIAVCQPHQPPASLLVEGERQPLCAVELRTRR